MKKIFFIILFISFKIYSQDSLRSYQVYFKNNLCYNSETNELFTGKKQNYKQKDHLVYEENFINGQRIKYTLYYNGKKRKVSDELFFNINEGYKEKSIRYEYSTDYKWITYYNNKKEKTLEENYKDGVLVYKCEYVNNKKNGILFFINDKGEKKECKYVNGKYIK